MKSMRQSNAFDILGEPAWSEPVRLTDDDIKDSFQTSVACIASAFSRVRAKLARFRAVTQLTRRVSCMLGNRSNCEPTFCFSWPMRPASGLLGLVTVRVANTCVQTLES